MTKRRPTHLIAMLFAFSLALLGNTSARAQVPPRMLFHGGPVITFPQVFLLFWGFDPNNSGDAAIISAVGSYVQGFTGYLTNGSVPPMCGPTCPCGTPACPNNGITTPLGWEPTLRQYGVWGANYLGYATDNTPGRLPAPADFSPPPTPNFANEIRAMQTAHLVPNFGDPTLFILVIAKDSSGCAGFHNQLAPNQYVGIASYGSCGLTTNPPISVLQQSEALIAHEIEEMATDPDLNGGWRYGDNAETEVCDGPGAGVSIASCDATITGLWTGDDQVVFYNGASGLVPHIIDNIGQNCSSFTTLEQPGIAPIIWNAQPTAFVRDQNNGLSVVSYSGSAWGAPQALGGTFWEAPTAITNGVFLDAFVRSWYGAILQYHRTTTTQWTGPTQISSAQILGPPSAVWHNSHKRVFGMGFDAHLYVFDDGGTGNWTISQLPIPAGNVLAMSPPQAFSRVGVANTIDIVFTGNNGHLYRAVWGTQASCPPFTDLGSSTTGLATETSRSSNTTRTDVFLTGWDNAIYQNQIINGNGNGYAPLGGFIVGSPAAADIDNQITAIELFARGIGASGSDLYLNYSADGTSFGGWTFPPSRITITSSPVVLWLGSEVFVRRHSDGHLVSWVFTGSHPLLDAGVVVH